MRKLRLMNALCLIMSLIAVLIAPVIASADSPNRAIVLNTVYPSITAGSGQDITFPIDVINKGQSDEQLNIAVISAPHGWDTVLKDKGYGIRSVSLLAGKTQTLTLQVKPAPDAVSGDNKIVLQGVSQDGAVKSTLELNIDIENQQIGGLTLNTMYPQLQGPNSQKFEFKVDIVNQGDTDRLVGLAASKPQDWQVDFQPAGDTKSISTLQIKAGETQSVNLEITPSTKADPGQYNIDFQASAGSVKSDIPFKIVLIGTTELSMAMSNGMLNTTATGGESTTTSFKVTNKGTGEIRNINFFSDKPDGWDVTFSPEKLDVLAPGDAREVNATIKTSNKSIAGDYQVTLSASGGSASDKQQLRVTVETPTVWGWAGVILVVIVIGALGGLFTRLGRR